MSTTYAIETNTSDNIGAHATNQARVATGTGDFYNQMSALAAYTGPVAAASMQASGDTDGAAVVAAAVNATAGYNYAGGALTTMPTGAYSGGITTYGGAPGALTTGMPMGTSSDDALMNAQAQMAQTQQSSIAMLMIQDQQSSQNRVFTMTSNLMAARDGLYSNMMRNIRGA